jgi:hypothetical protein
MQGDKPPPGPVFIIGTGRSGTTLLFDILYPHPHLGWICQYCAGFRATCTDHAAAVLFRRRLGRRLALALSPRRPVQEPYAFWRMFTAGFSRSCRDLDERDIDAATAGRIVAAVSSQLEQTRKPRLLSKYTGWSRIRFVDRIFPDARYINVMRDGRDTAWSLLQQEFWDGWRGPTQWRWGDLEPADLELWKRTDRSFYVLAGLQWKILTENISSVGRQIGNRYLEIRYERLVSDFASTMDEVLSFAGLPRPDTFMNSLDGITLRNANGKWREAARKDIAHFEEHLGPALARFGY